MLNLLLGPLFGRSVRDDRALLPAYTRSRSEKRGAPSAAFQGVEIGRPMPAMEQQHRDGGAPTFVRPAINMSRAPSRTDSQHNEPLPSTSRPAKTIDMRAFGSTVRPSSPTNPPPIYSGSGPKSPAIWSGFRAGRAV